MAKRPRDLTGERFGRLVVLSEADRILTKRGTFVRAFNCLCDCGNKTVVRSSYLTSGQTRSCGCSRGGVRTVDLTGQRIGKLLVLREVDHVQTKIHDRYWECRCECGKIVVARQNNLIYKNVRSCGCIRSELTRKRSAQREKPKTSSPRINLIGNRYGLLTVVGLALPIITKSGKRKTAWLCRCDCGKERIVYGGNLKQGHVKSCGCSRWKRPSMDLTGKTFGRLTVIKEGDRKIQPNGKKRRTWLCHCQCGKEVVVIQNNLTRGMTHSCGCLRSERHVYSEHQR
jgi:hypothetical protein